MVKGLVSVRGRDVRTGKATKAGVKGVKGVPPSTGPPGVKSKVVKVVAGLKVHVMEPKAPHTHTLVFLHQCNGGAADYSHARKHWFDRLVGVRIVCPDSGGKRFSAFYQDKTPHWFDYERNYKVRDPAPDAATLAASTDALVRVVQAEVREMPAERVLLGGWSQGGQCSLHLLMDPRVPALGGYMCGNGSLMPQTELDAEKRSMPMRFYIGGADDIFPAPTVLQRLQRLEKDVPGGFEDVAARVFPKRGHDTELQGKWIEGFVREMQARDRMQARPLPVAHLETRETETDAPRRTLGPRRLSYALRRRDSR